MKTTLHYIIAILLFSLNAVHAFAQGDEEPFEISGDANYNYNEDKTLLTISGGGTLTITGDGMPVNCGIVVAADASPYLTFKDLNIVAENALVFKGATQGSQSEYSLTLQGTNRLESTSGAGIDLNVNLGRIKGKGSLTVIGGNAAFGIQGTVYINENACIVAIGGEGASGISPAPNEYTLDSGLLIYGEQLSDGNIYQQYSKLKGDITLGGNLEIPSWATVTIADGQTFTIAPNVTLTNNGTINNAGTIHNNGTLEGNPLHQRIIFRFNDPAYLYIEEQDIPQGKALPTNIFTRPGYTFQGWYTDPDGGTKVETVTGPQTLYAQWKADEPPVDPEPPYVPPTPIYYSVYLPQIEGAVTDPGPGEYEVESWNTFRFYLTLDSAYSESQPIVTTDRGETLVPRTSDGAYLVKYVRTDVEVFIDGIIQNPPPVANEAISTDALAPQIWAEGTMLCIRMQEALPSAPVRIFTVDGRLYDSFTSTPGLNRRQLPTGIYIVRVGDTACKVIIK